MKHLLVLGLFAVSIAACGDSKNSGDDNPPPMCTALGVACTAGSECCSTNCDTTVGLCAPPAPGSCLAADAECMSGAECCTSACVNYRCSSKQCTSDGQSCSTDGECCGGVCDATAKTCTPLNAVCHTSGNACTGDAECCSGFCKDSICNAAPSYCTQISDACSLDSECCSGICQKASGATRGLCINVPSGGGTTECKPAGEVCADPALYMGQDLPICGGECCSRACRPFGPSGVMICQPPSGCRPTGETCKSNTDCCGGDPTASDYQHVKCEIQPGFTIGKCDNGQSCRAKGQVCKLNTTSCNAENNCCSNECHQDALGIPRCGGSDNCTPPAAGTVCGSSADCCGNPCTPNGSGMYVCSGSCVAQGGTCTTTTDCCAGLPCDVPPGSTMGTCGATQGCSAYGQTCTDSTMCCSGLECMDWDGNAGTAMTCGSTIIIL